MTPQNLIITNLMSDLVKRNGSDLHLTGDTVPYFRIQGSILPASESIYKEENLISFIMNQKIWVLIMEKFLQNLLKLR